eukprot:maker-scaffold224_size251237-snap-gene-0.17 protein:Tk05436 transcript:maker-scaffold224_size251237-snap-gene-0.17-mRNA-1 annotation:"ankyrin repeat-containing protein"
MARPQETVSWFVAMSDFCSKTAESTLSAIINLATCFIIPDEQRGDGTTNHTNIRALTIAQENRDSMGLLAAIFTGRENKAQELLMLPWTNINAQYTNGNTPLILAVQGNNEIIVRLLLNHPDLKVNLRGLDGYTALIRACQDRPDFVRMLLARADTEVNLANYFGTTALMYAIRCGNEEAVQHLLMRVDIEVNFQSRHGENALIEAVTYRRYEIACALISRDDVDVDVLDNRDRTPLIMAVQYGYLPLVRLLVFNACSDPCAEDDQGHNALHYALKRGSSPMVHDLVEVLSYPQPLMRLCRTVIRRTIRDKVGRGHRLKPHIERFENPMIRGRIRSQMVAFERASTRKWGYIFWTTLACVVGHTALVAYCYGRLPHSYYFGYSEAATRYLVQGQETRRLQAAETTWRFVAQHFQFGRNPGLFFSWDPHLSIGIVTTQRTQSDYLLQTLMSLVDESTYVTRDFDAYSPMGITVFNADPEPQSHKVAVIMKDVFPNHDLYYGQRPRKYNNQRLKETNDYLNSMRHLLVSTTTEFILILEDDMAVKPNFGRQMKLLLDQYLSRNDRKWMATKLFYPVEHKGFELTLASLLELTAWSLIGGILWTVIRHVILSRLWQVWPIGAKILVLIHALHSLSILLALGRQHSVMAVLHTAFPFRHDVFHGSCTGAILYRRELLPDLIDFIDKALWSEDPDPIDFIIADYFEANPSRLAYSLEFNLFNHIGFDSSIGNNGRRAKNFLEY